MQDGAVFISAGEEPLLADTPAGRISISAHSNLYVQQHASGALIISNLGLTSTSLELGRNGQSRTESIGAGAEFIVADMYFGPRELREELGIQSNYEIVPCNVPGITFIKHKMLAKEIREKERIVDCDPERYPEHYLKKRIRTIRSVTGHLLSKAPDANTPGADQESRHIPSESHSYQESEPKEVSLLPVSFIAPAAAPALRVAKNNGVFLAQLGEADVDGGPDGVLTLNDGELLLHTSQATSLKIGAYTVSLQPKVVVLVEKIGDVVKIRNLHESKADSVKLMKPGGHLLALQISDEVILSPDHGTAMSTMGDKVGRRGIKATKLQSGITLTKSEVSLVSLLTENHLLQTLRNNKDSACRKLHNHLLKTAVSYWLVKGNRRPYNTIHPGE